LPGGDFEQLPLRLHKGSQMTTELPPERIAEGQSARTPASRRRIARPHYALDPATIAVDKSSALAGVALFRTGLTLEADVTGALNLPRAPAPPEEGYRWQQK
jgi:hypothetical protein